MSPRNVTARHVVDWVKLVDGVEMACEIRDVSLQEVADAIGISASGLTRLRQGKHLEADGLAALVAWLYPQRIPHWIKESPAPEQDEP